MTPAERYRAAVVGKVIFHENQQRLAALGELLTSDLERGAAALAPDSPVVGFLDLVETSPELRGADALAFGDVLAELAAAPKAAVPEAAAERLAARIESDRKALAEIKKGYERELDKIFGRFDTRGLAVRREGWESYVSHLKTLYSRDSILKEYEKTTRAIAGIRERPPKERDGPLEIYGGGLPPRSLVLTFDDGPHARYTDRILEILQKYKVKAVFFELGRNLGVVQEERKVHPTRAAAASRRLLAAGMPVANHSYSHALLPALSDREIGEEIESTNRMLRVVSSTSTLLFRRGSAADEGGALEHRFPRLGRPGSALHRQPGDSRRRG